MAEKTIINILKSEGKYMPLRPIDAIFVQPNQRRYVVYYRGELWQLARIKLDMASWQRRKPFTGDSSELFLSQNQYIDDRDLAAILRTLNLPASLHGISLPKFEEWWLAHGYEWLKKILLKGDSPLAEHASQDGVIGTAQSASTVIQAKETVTISNSNNSTNFSKVSNDDTVMVSKSNSTPLKKTGDVFEDMLAELAEEVLNL